MGTPRLLFNFSFDTALNRDAKKTQFNLTAISPSSKNEKTGMDRDGSPLWSVDCQYASIKDLEDSFNACKNFVDASIISAKISMHLCTHANGESEDTWIDCRNLNYNEFIK